MHDFVSQVTAVVAECSAVIRSRRQVVAMLIAVVFFFFACMLPFKLITLLAVVSPVEPIKIMPERVYVYVLYFSRVMYYINSAVNPILYNVMSSKFRDGFKRVLSRCCGRGSNSSAYYQSSLYYGQTGATNNTTTDTASSSLVGRINSSVFRRGRDVGRFGNQGGGSSVVVRSGNGSVVVTAKARLCNTTSAPSPSPPGGRGSGNNCRHRTASNSIHWVTETIIDACCLLILNERNYCMRCRGSYFDLE